MRVPQVSDRIKEAPAQALRGVFAGIGQVLLVADRLRNKTPADQQAPQTRAPEPSRTRADPATSAAPVPQAPPPLTTPAAPAGPVAPAAEGVTKTRDLDKTGNVRLLTREPAGAGVTTPAADATVTAGEEAGAPLPNYADLSIASLRARLRNLDVAQVKQLAEYEKTHAARTEVVTMFERRVAKLEAETTPEERGEAEAEAEIEAQEEETAEVQEEVGVEAEGED
jgi:hypothetical protein